MRRLTARFRDCGLEIHKTKSKIIYCKDSNRRDDFEQISFDFLGFQFRPRRCYSEEKGVHPNFLPAVSKDAKKSINRTIRSWHIQLKNDKSLLDISRMFNPILRGWLQYYGKFYPSELRQIWRNFNAYLVQWVRRKYKHFARHRRRAKRYLDRMARCNPKLFVHWQLGCFPCGLSDRSRMS